MTTLIKKFKATFLIAGVTLGLMFGSAQQSKAAFYDNYLQYFHTYINLYSSTHNPYYLYTGYAFYYYYLSGYYGDHDAFVSDPYGDYSNKQVRSYYYASHTHHDDSYNLYAYYADYYYRIYNFAPTV